MLFWARVFFLGYFGAFSLPAFVLRLAALHSAHSSGWLVALIWLLLFFDLGMCIAIVRASRINFWDFGPWVIARAGFALVVGLLIDVPALTPYLSALALKAAGG